MAVVSETRFYHLSSGGLRFPYEPRSGCQYLKRTQATADLQKIQYVQYSIFVVTLRSPVVGMV